MKRFTRALLGAALFGAATATMASSVNIAGLNLNTGPTFAVASIYENAISAPGQTLSGYGEVTQINGVAVGSLCGGCELTYRFGGYVVTGLTPNSVSFAGGYVNFYLGFGANNDFNPFSSPNSAADLAAATNGTLFLTLAGHQIDAAGSTFSGTGTNIGTTTPAGFGAGLLDVDSTGSLYGNTAGAGAVGNAFFDTNTITALFGGPADFAIGGSFSSIVVPHPGECPQGPACVAGSADIRGSIAAVPEPETYALLLAGLGVVGFVARRRKHHQA